VAGILSACKDSKMKLIVCSIIGALAASASPIVSADTQSDLSFAGQASAGVMHNSALSVDEIDDVSNESDSGKEAVIKLNLKWLPSDKVKLVTAYSYQQQNFNTLSQYDLALHQVNIDASYQLDQGEVGLRFDVASASLAKNTFLDFQQASIYYGVFIQPQTYIRTSFKVKNKSFAELSDRDADGMGLSVDLFYFTNSANTMLMLGFNVEQEDTINEEFTFKGLGFGTKVSHKFTLFGLGTQLGLDWRYQIKDYMSINTTESASQAGRDENRQVLTVSWSLNILDGLAIKTEIEHGDYGSDLDTLSYKQNLTSVGLSYQW
jgi:hypothetical protein